MSRTVYAVPSFYNLLMDSHVERIDTFLRRLSHCCYTNSFFVLRDIVNGIDITLLKKIIRATHCFHQLPVKPHLGFHPKGHPYILPLCKPSLFRHPFVTHCLFKLVWFYNMLFYIVLLAIFTLIRWQRSSAWLKHSLTQRQVCFIRIQYKNNTLRTTINTNSCSVLTRNGSNDVVSPEDKSHLANGFLQMLPLKPQNLRLELGFLAMSNQSYAIANATDIGENWGFQLIHAIWKYHLRMTNIVVDHINGNIKTEKSIGEYWCP